MQLRTVLAMLSCGALATSTIYCGGAASRVNDESGDASAGDDAATDVAVDTDSDVDGSEPSGSVKFSPEPGSVSGAQTICLYSGNTCGDDLPGTAIFYTLDGSPANEASQLYTGPITLPAPPSTARNVVINAVLVQMVSTTAPGCSSAKPCYGVIVQDGMNVKANLNTNVACPASGPDSCPATNFEQSGSVMPPVQYGDCGVGDDRGVRGAPSTAWYNVSQSQPTADPYVNSNLSVQMGLGVTSAVDCGPGTAGTGDTEFLIPAIRNDNQLDGATGIACDNCTSFATSFYIANDYEVRNGKMTDPANLSEMELDQNQLNSTYAAATGHGYGTFNMRASMKEADPVTGADGKLYGQWQYSNQSGTWKAFPLFFPDVAPVTHDSPMPFGKLAAIDEKECPTASSFTPGVTNALYHGGETSYGLEPGFLLVDQGTPDAESILLTGAPGGAVTGCIRGAGGTTPHPHGPDALATLTVKVQAHATQGLGTGSKGCIGDASAKNAMYMDYLSLNGNYYGTAASFGPNYQMLMGANLPSPAITVLDTWQMQSVGSEMQSTVCTWFYDGSGSDNKFYNQKQPYTKPGTGGDAQVGIFDMHDNVTASWGIIGSPSQAIYAQAP